MQEWGSQSVCFHLSVCGLGLTRGKGALMSSRFGSALNSSGESCSPGEVQRALICILIASNIHRERMSEQLLCQITFLQEQGILSVISWRAEALAPLGGSLLLHSFGIQRSVEWLSLNQHGAKGAQKWDRDGDGCSSPITQLPSHHPAPISSPKSFPPWAMAAARSILRHAAFIAGFHCNHFLINSSDGFISRSPFPRA